MTPGLAAALALTLALTGTPPAAETTVPLAPAREAAPSASIELEIPFFCQLESGHGFRPGGSACFRAAKAMAKEGGAKVLGPRTRIQIAKKEDRKGRITRIDAKAAEAGIRYIDEELAAGRPVVVGVSHRRRRINVDRLTDHFVIIIGRIEVGGELRYIHWDPATRHLQRAKRYFVVGPEGRLTRSGPVNRGAVDRRFAEVTMVRINRRVPFEATHSMPVTSPPLTSTPEAPAAP